MASRSICRLLVALDQSANPFLDLPQISQGAVYPLEQGDDVLLQGIPLADPVRPAGRSSRSAPPSKAVSQASAIYAAPSSLSASRSLDESSLRAFSRMMVRSGREMIPAMYTAARPLTTGPGGAMVVLSTRSTSRTSSTSTPTRWFSKLQHHDPGFFPYRGIELEALPQVNHWNGGVAVRHHALEELGCLGERRRG